MAQYKYTKLDRTAGEIRLMKLLPGKFDDEIAFSIFHATLHPAKKTQSKRLPLQVLQKTLPDPPNQFVGEVLDGRYIFMHWGARGVPNSFDHPIPTFDRELYVAPPTLQHQPQFDALSYTWGNPKDPITARVVPRTPSKPDCAIEIGQNLACALRYLRYEDRPRNLWVDAVCINQEDVDERNVEVKRMKDLYSTAPRTIIWLGEESGNSSLALSTLHYYGNQIEVIKIGPETMIGSGDSPGAAEPDWWHPNTQLPYDEAIWSAIGDLLRRPWFERIWVLQEAMLPGAKAHIQCGAVTVPWLSVQKAIMQLSQNLSVPSEIGRLLHQYEYGFHPRLKDGASLLLKWSRVHQCSDPRDKIYGILGLVPESVREHLQIDYSKTVSQIYQDMVLAEIKGLRRLHILRECFLGDRMNNAPSWVPNLACTTANRSALKNMTSTFQTPSLHSTAEVRQVSPDVLEVSGVHCATVSSLGPTTSDALADGLQIFHKWEASHTGGSISTGIATPSLDEFLQTLVTYYKPFNGLRDEFTLDELRTQYIRSASGDAASSQALLKYIDQIGYTENSRYFVTDKGTVGFGPSEVESGKIPLITKNACTLSREHRAMFFVYSFINRDSGDFLCLLLGSNFPMLLRPTASNQFLVVGACFSRFLNKGEGLLGPIPSPWEMELEPFICEGVFNGYYVHFKNTLTLETTLNDLRLPALPSQWEAAHSDEAPPSIWYYNCYKNKYTGEIMHSDPRLTSQALKEQGVDVQVFRLV